MMDDARWMGDGWAMDGSGTVKPNEAAPARPRQTAIGLQSRHDGAILARPTKRLALAKTDTSGTVRDIAPAGLTL